MSAAPWPCSLLVSLTEKTLRVTCCGLADDAIVLPRLRDVALDDGAADCPPVVAEDRAI